MLVSAITYGLLRKSEIFGPAEENTAVNGVIALMLSFMIWAYPVISGVDIGAQMSNFFMHGFTVTLVLLVSIMLMSMFAPPDLPGHFAKTVLKGNKSGVVIIIGLFLGFLTFFTSGIYTMVFGGQVMTGLSGELGSTIGVLLILVVPLIFIAWGGGQTTPPSSSEKKE